MARLCISATDRPCLKVNNVVNWGWVGVSGGTGRRSKQAGRQIDGGGDLSSELFYLSASTVALPMVGDLELFDVTHNSMIARWRGAAGASGYMILYAPLTEGESADEKEVRGRDGGERQRDKEMGERWWCRQGSSGVGDLNWGD